MTYRKFIVWSLLISVTGFGAANSSYAACPTIKFEKVQSLSIQNIARMGFEKLITGNGGGISFFRFDEENHPHSGDLNAFGFLIGCTGDNGEIPVGGYIWSSVKVKLVKWTSNEDADDGKAESSAKFVSTESIPGCKKAALIFSVKRSGEVYANGELVGKVDQHAAD